ncbi:MAG: hypothetical protein COB66_06090 [Coxiella sp. (in: Bacteria)]|nr:MAG: hypothetical protein COB66_06090 [Coxiella sp. (in: g-proteobacteria)]
MAQKITIAQICPRLNSGGIERGTVDVAIAVKKAGFRSIVISGGGQLSQEIAASGVEHFELPLYLKSPLAIRRNAKQLRDIIHDWNINLVHARSRAPIWAAHHALKGSDADFVTSCHSPHGLGPLGLKKYYNRSITFGKRIIAISEYIADYLQQNYRVASDKIDVIYRGIDCTQFNPDTIDQAQIIALKNQLHIPPDKTVILLPGRITRWKGQDVFIKA